MAQIIYKNMHVYVLHRSNNLDHKMGRPAILLKFKNKYSLVWYGTTKIDINAQENPLLLKINNVNGYFYSSGIEKIKTIFLQSKWVDYSTNNAYKLSINEQRELISKFVSFTLEHDPYLEIKNLKQEIQQLKNEIELLKNYKSKTRNRG